MTDERTTYLLLAAGAVIVAAGVLLVLYYRHLNAQRRRWARYSRHGQAEPVSVVCRTCRRRTYSARAIREGICPSCGSKL